MEAIEDKEGNLLIRPSQRTTPDHDHGDGDGDGDGVGADDDGDGVVAIKVMEERENHTFLTFFVYVLVYDDMMLIIINIMSTAPRKRLFCPRSIKSSISLSCPFASLYSTRYVHLLNQITPPGMCTYSSSNH